MTEENIVEADASQRVYEVGYLLLPSIPEEHISEEVGRIKNAIDTHRGVMIADASPQLRTLAYEMEKHVGTRKERFDSAYFGWVKFEMEPSDILLLKAELDSNPSIIRFILIKTARDAHIPPKPRELKENEVAELAPEVAHASTIATDAEIDKSIEELVLE